MRIDETAKIHPAAIVEESAIIGPSVRIWAWAHVMHRAVIDGFVTIAERVYIGEGVNVGLGCKLQVGSSIHKGVTLGKNVFIGPGVQTTNDIAPRAHGDWLERFRKTVIEDDVGIGANATILCGITLGAGCMVGAGSVVTRDVPKGWLVLGNPARKIKRIPYKYCPISLVAEYEPCQVRYETPED